VGLLQHIIKPARCRLGLLILVVACPTFAQVQIGDNTKLDAGGMFTFGYAGDYGTDINSSHGLNFGVNGKLDGSYYNPNFISFNATPYYNQSRADSDSQSLTGASGIAGTTNFFTGSNFPGSVTYHFDHNSTSTFGLAGLPNFTTVGDGQGFAIGWSALLHGLPTLSFGYSQGAGSGNVYGTDEQTSSDSKIFNFRSTYQIEGFHLNGLYSHNTFDSKFPEFLAGEEAVENSSGDNYGLGANHALPLHGSFFVNFSRASASSNFLAENSDTSSYTDTNETAGVTFNPTHKLNLFANESYIDNLSGYLSQSLSSVSVIPVNLGSGSNSMTVGGGASYNFTQHLYGQAQATHYDQRYFGKDYTGTYISGTIAMSKKLFDMFSFSATVIDSENGQGTNAVGLIGDVNFYHRFGPWQTSAHFDYAQNVQTILITYTTSYYTYGGNVHRRFPHHMQWSGAINGTHSGLTNQPDTSSHSETYSTAFGTRQLSLNGLYTKSGGLSFLGIGGLQAVAPTPGLTNTILFAGDSYGGGISGSPFSRMVLSANFSRAISNTSGGFVPSRNNTEIFYTQLQYHFRRIGLQAGYTKFLQSISAGGALPANTNAYFVGISRWFDLF
jgi:hypothetical protein